MKHIIYNFNGGVHQLRMAEFHSVRQCESWQHYAYGELAPFADKIANAAHLMKDRFTNEEIAVAMGCTKERVAQAKKQFGIRRSLKRRISDAHDRIIRSGLPMVRLCEMTGLNDKSIRQHAKRNGIDIPKYYRPYSESELALFDTIPSNYDLARLLHRDMKSVSTKRCRMKKEAELSRSNMAA